MMCSMLLTVSLLFAQSATATLSGTVVDQTGAVVPSVEITLENIATALKRQAMTNEQGYFTIPLLPPGTYTLTAQLAGFAPLRIPDIILNVGDQKALRLQLKPGNVNQSVDVTAEAPLINNSPEVGTVIDRKFVENLPLNGRGFNALLELTPGVTLARANASNQGQFNVNGQRSSSNYFMVDGVSANAGMNGGGIGQNAAGTQPATSIQGGLNSLVSADALQEFRVQTSSFAPEFGRTPGGQVSIVTRSGTNQFHGSLFEYLRNEKLDANNWFANFTRQPKAPLRQNDFGGVLGGPILRSRTFFFFSYEGARLVQPQTVTNISVPSVAARNAAPAAIKPYLNAYPLPNGAQLTNGAAILNASYSNPSELDAGSLRLDHSFKHTVFFGRYADSRSPGVLRGGSFGLSQITESLITTRSFTAGATSSIGTSKSNDFRTNWTATRANATFRLDDFGGAIVPGDSLLFPAGGAIDNAIFSIAIGNAGVLSHGKNTTNKQRQVNMLDTFTWSRGGHLFKFGGDVRILQPANDSRATDVTVSFSTVGDPAVTTQPSGTALSQRVLSGTVSTRAPNFEMRYLNLSFFLQDAWRASSRITLTYGARWDTAPPPVGLNGYTLFAASGAGSPDTLGLAPEGTPLWKTSYGNVAPRAGLAYVLRNSSHTGLVLRLGAGTFYDLVGGYVATQTSGAPYVNTRLVTAGTEFPYSPGILVKPAIPATPPYAGIFLTDPLLKTPRAYQWNFAFEQSLGSGRAVSATYVGARGHNLLRSTTYLGPNPTFQAGATVELTRSDSASSYNALQLQFRGRFSESMSVLGSYTLSRSIDNASYDTFFGTPDIRSNRGYSDFDARHVFSTAMSYSPAAPKARWLAPLLEGWGFDTIFQARSGFPVNVTVTRNLGFGNYAFRPDLVPGIPIWVDDPNVPGGRRINNARPSLTVNQVGPFLVPSELRQGNLERNALRGFGMYQFDLGLRREFRIYESLKLQFKAESFNFTNHPSFADPSAGLGTLSATGTLPAVSSTFGTSNTSLNRSLGAGGTSGGLNPLFQVGGPRSIQLSLRLMF